MNHIMEKLKIYATRIMLSLFLKILMFLFLMQAFISVNAQDYGMLSTKAPGFTLTDLQGDTLRLDDYRGNFVVIHIATTWCPFCNAGAPSLEKLNQDYYDRHVRVLIIDVMEPGSLVSRKIRDRFNLTFPILLDKYGAVSARYAPDEAQPDLAREEVMIASNLLLDPEGRIRFFSLLDSREFDAKLVNLRHILDELLTVN